MANKPPRENASEASRPVSDASKKKPLKNLEAPKDRTANVKGGVARQSTVLED
jgi:hypothetical protein